MYGCMPTAQFYWLERLPIRARGGWVNAQIVIKCSNYDWPPILPDHCPLLSLSGLPKRVPHAVLLIFSTDRTWTLFGYL